MEIGTSLEKKDTDCDGLSDYEEKNVYLTDPLAFDTDKDGVSDGREIGIGTNPLVYDDKFEILSSSNDEDTVKASVRINLSGDQVETLNVEKYENDFFFPTNMPGYVGGAYDFSVDGKFDEATISFEFDESLLEDGTFDPVIYYFDEENQSLEELETTVIGNTAYTKVNHFSTYVLINRIMFKNAFEWQDVWETSGYSKAEIVLVIDDSGSLGGDYGYNATTGFFKGGMDPEHKRLEVAREFVDKANENAKIGIIKFDGEIDNITSGLIKCDTKGKNVLKNYLKLTYDASGDYNKHNVFDSRGYTEMYAGIEKAMDQFSSDSEDTLKTLIVFTDGIAQDKYLHSSVISNATKENVKIYTVGLGDKSSSYFKEYLQPLAVKTGGAFYFASDADELKKIYKDIIEKIDFETDSDGDGISDYYEDNFWVFNGLKLKLDKNNPDTDNDGVPDNEEVSVSKFIYNESKTKAIVINKILTNPWNPDSDYDGIDDSVDEAPWNNNFTGTLVSDKVTTGSEVEFKMDYSWFFGNNTEYNKNLSITSSLYAAAVYQPSKLRITDSSGEHTTKGENFYDVLEYFGMDDAKTYNLVDMYNDKHVSEVGLGHRKVLFGNKTKNVIAVTVRGTNGTIEEWSSDFDIGNKADFGKEKDWKVFDHHMGFDIPANRIMYIIDDYIKDCELDPKECVYWITGHSRGAAIANIIGAHYEDEGKEAFTYTYASPNTVMFIEEEKEESPNATTRKKPEEYKTIFNIVNGNDFVPRLPMTQWGYKKYGRTAMVSISGNYEKEWENLTKIFDYNPDTFGLQKTIDEFANIIPKKTDSDGKIVKDINGNAIYKDPREEVYKYTCSCHGDGTNDNITIRNRGISQKSRENAKKLIPDNAKPYCIITDIGNDFAVCQTPAYFMQLIAAVTKGEISGSVFLLRLNIADRYEKAKKMIVKSALGGLEHPHYTESYYILANNIDKEDFE